MNYTIVTIEQDMADKFRARIDYENNSYYFKFNIYPTEQMIDEAFVNYIKLRDETLDQTLELNDPT